MSKAKKIKEDARRKLSKQLMKDSFLDEHSFVWEVATGGYRWVDSPKGRRLVGEVTTAGRLDADDDSPATGKGVKRYYPLEEGKLFRKFADVPQTEAGCKVFADKFGLLRFEGSSFGELSGDWCGAITEMHLAVTVWDMIEEGSLAKHLLETRPEVPPEHPDHRPYQGLWHLYQPTNPKKWWFSVNVPDAKDPGEAGKILVKTWINYGLEQETALRIAWNPRRGKFHYRVAPRTLLGCMWWQFARLFLGEVEYGECRFCGKPLEQGKDAFMSTRVFCSDACKQKDHRERVKKAKGLHAEGKAVKTIAHDLHTRPQVIAKWLKKKK